MVISLQISPQLCKSPDLAIFTINTDVAFSEDKISIEIIIRNHLGIFLLAKCIPRPSHFSVDYDELLALLNVILHTPCLLEGLLLKVIHSMLSKASVGKVKISQNLDV